MQDRQLPYVRQQTRGQAVCSVHWPSKLTAVPSSQRVHMDAPAALAYFPASHWLHACMQLCQRSYKRKEMCRDRIHVGAFAHSSWCTITARHCSVHTEFSIFAQCTVLQPWRICCISVLDANSGHTGKSPALRPAGHLVQLNCPGRSLYLPAGQRSHTV